MQTISNWDRFAGKQNLRRAGLHIGEKRWVWDLLTRFI
jgi:hypothetical protein